MTAQRPDVLPFATPSTLGLPCHGLVVSNQLTLPNARVIAYPSDSGTLSGETVYVQHPKATAVARSTAEQTADSAAGYEWRNYDLLTGSARNIGGVELGSGHWLYCDANIAWDVSITLTKSGYDHILDVYLEGAFGVFSKTLNLTMTRRKLATVTYTPLTYDAATQASFSRDLSRLLATSHSKTGAKTVVNIGAVSSGTQSWNKSDLRYGNSTVGFHNAFVLTISGDGSLTTGSIGTGISASFASLATAPEMVVSEWNTTTYLCDEFAPSSSVYGNQYEYFYATDKDGNVSHIVELYDATEAFSYTNLDCDAQTYSSAQMSQSITYRYTFAGVSLEAVVEKEFTYPPETLVSEEVNGEPDTFSSLAGTYIHPNVVMFRLVLGSGATNRLIAADGTTTDVAYTSYAPSSSSVSWQPGTRVITFTEGAVHGYV